MTTKARVLLVLKTIATTRATYRFLAALLVALGVTQGASLVTGLETAACLLLGGCG